MNYRSALTKICTFLGGLYFFLEFVLPEQVFGFKIDALDEDISNGLITVSAMAIGLGIINILSIHGSKIVFRRSGYGNSIALLAGLVMMLLVTALDWRGDLAIAHDTNRIFELRDFATRIQTDAQSGASADNTVQPFFIRNRTLITVLNPLLNEIDASTRDIVVPTGMDANDRSLLVALGKDELAAIAAARDAAQALATSDDSSPDLLAANTTSAKALSDLGAARLALLNLTAKYSLPKKEYDFLYTGLFTALGAAMFSLLGFYIASAAYRAFRVRSGESALMMTAAFLVMLGQIPFGLWIWHGFPEVRLWLLSVPSAAAFRAIKIGAGVASLVMAYRMWFSIESKEFTQK